MKKFALLCCAALALTTTGSFAQQPADTKTPKQFGEAFTQTPTLTPDRVPYVLKDKKELNEVSVAGQVTEVCQKEGCWLKMVTNTENPKEEVFVKMKDHAFLVPKDISGKRVIVFGNIEKKEQSVKEQKHYLEDAGAPEEEINAITTDRKSVV